MTRSGTTGDGLLDRVMSGASLLDSLHAGAELRSRAAAGECEPDRLLEAFHAGDELARVLLMAVIARVPGAAASSTLRAALEGGSESEREHAAWALGARAPMPEAVPALAAIRAAGGFGGMLAELTLDDWRPADRLPATAARQAGRSGERPLRIVQIFMQGFLDAGLSRPGAGDGGGLATLLVHLSAALAARPEVEHVTTLTRGLVGEGVPTIHRVPSEPVAPGASIERIRFGGDGYLAVADMWAHRRELEHALERALRRLAPIDAVHLRFADVATLAATRVCERLGLPVHFTLAPDPHALIRQRQESGSLDRSSFMAADRAEHLLFRARLVERMRDRAAGLALLPRGSAREELWELVRLPAHGGARRIRTVPEGISMKAVDAAALELSGPRRPGGAAEDLASRVRTLPARRHGLPLILSVGRLHRVKGFATLLEAWAGAPDLRDAFNLAIVGGDLDRPTAEERTVLRSLEAAAGRYPGAADGLLLLGHRRHADVIRLMAATRAGLAGTVGPAGVYACASVKEEFGLALLEAMASGLSVLGPALGGPPTFIEDGVTGVIASTSSVGGMRDGLRRAAQARLDARRAELAAATVRERFTIDAMAAGLVDLYDRGGAAAAVA
jgi:glycosyltransferase involved in cell wall biosynthesis